MTTDPANKESTAMTTDYPPTCIITGEPGENPDDCTTHAHEPTGLPDYIWPDPHSHGYIDAWNGWYPDLAMALRDAPAGVGTPWVLEPGSGLLSDDERP